MGVLFPAFSSGFAYDKTRTKLLFVRGVKYTFLAVFPFALLVLFIFGRVIQSPSVEESVVNDLQRLFPAVELTTPFPR